MPVAVAVTAALGSTFAGGIGAAVAAPSDYPTWDEINAAKGNEALTQQKIDELTRLVASLQSQADALGTTAQKKAETYNQALDALDDATERAKSLKGKADDADARATKSMQRAAAVIARMTRSGADGDMSAQMLFGQSQDGDLLAKLSTLGRVNDAAQTVYEQAVSDRNLSRALSAQASQAEQVRAKLFDETKQSYADALAASDAAQQQLASQQDASDQLFAQLATLKGTTIQLEQERAEGIASDQQAAAQAAAAQSAPARPSSGGSASGSAAGGSASAGGPAASAPAPSQTQTQGASAPAQSAPSPAPVQNTPAPVQDTPPNASLAQGAIAFAKAQLGDAYQFAGAGPDVWDCSGLTLMAYRSVGVSIGTHSATNQYLTMKAQGRLHPLSDMQPGDLIWYTSNGGGEMYHVTIYLGGGQMIEAPKPGYNVRIVPVRYGDAWGQVGRPTG